MERGKEKTQANNDRDRGRNEQQQQNTTEMENNFRRKAGENPHLPSAYSQPSINQNTN